MSAAEALVNDRVVRVAPLGVRFLDPATGRFVNDLTVTARLIERNGARERPMFANASGVFALHAGVPSVRDFEISRVPPPVGDDYWSNFPPPADCWLTVVDPLDRFLPFEIQAGVPTRGLALFAVPPDGAPGQAVRDCPLFSAPWRAVPEGLAALRADLFDPIADRAAAWAIVEVRSMGRLLGRGMANEAGQVAVYFSYPAPLVALHESVAPGGPVPPSPASLWEQAWNIAIRIAYAPPAVPRATGSVAGDLGLALAQLESPGATIWSDAARTSVMAAATLRFGED